MITSSTAQIAHGLQRRLSKLFSCPFVPNKSGYATDVYQFFGCHAACGRGLYRQEPDKDEDYLFARQKLLSGVVHLVG
jgi:hypothetical protein